MEVKIVNSRIIFITDVNTISTRTNQETRTSGNIQSNLLMTRSTSASATQYQIIRSDTSKNFITTQHEFLFYIRRINTNISINSSSTTAIYRTSIRTQVIGTRLIGREKNIIVVSIIVKYY